MNTTATASRDATTDARVGQVDLKLEVITESISDRVGQFSGQQHTIQH